MPIDYVSDKFPGNTTVGTTFFLDGTRFTNPKKSDCCLAWKVPLVPDKKKDEGGNVEKKNEGEDGCDDPAANAYKNNASDILLKLMRRAPCCMIGVGGRRLFSFISNTF